MSQPITETAEKVTDTPVEEARDKALDKADDATPDSLTPDPPKEDTADPSDAKGGTDGVSEALAALSTQVQTLEDTVKELIKPDDSPVKKGPWTKRGRKR